MHSAGGRLPNILRRVSWFGGPSKDRENDRLMHSNIPVSDTSRRIRSALFGTALLLLTCSVNGYKSRAVHGVCSHELCTRKTHTSTLRSSFGIPLESTMGFTEIDEKNVYVSHEVLKGLRKVPGESGPCGFNRLVRTAR
jgi:hypothetical protein